VTSTNNIIFHNSFKNAFKKVVMIRANAPCTNCGEIGHQQRICSAPVSSYGIILFRIKDPNWNPLEKLATQETINNIVQIEDVEFCLIQRKDSIGFVELVRGKYKLSDLEYIRHQISGMTEKERQLIKTSNLDTLWKQVWGEQNKHYKHDLETSRDKFQTLKNGVFCPKMNKTVTLDSLLEEIPCQWNTPEWGFPKGRRNRFESDYECAVRETCEETGLSSSQFNIIFNLKPIRETFFGNNHVYYTHVYYLAWCPKMTDLKMKTDNQLMNQEIGNIGWFSLEECLLRIRPTNLEKRQIILQASRILKNTCPVIFHHSIIPATINSQRNHVIRQDERYAWNNERGHTYGFIEDDATSSNARE
jgi:8-oxo-dGTP pyrophosphatase MutT (NUDIX family)